MLRLCVHIICLSILCLTACSPYPQTADILITNAQIYTINSELPEAEAIAIKDGKIIFVGTSVEAESFRGEGTKHYDLQGKTVLPGLHDCHVHPIGGAASTKYCQLSGILDQKSIRNEIVKYLETHKEDEVIFGRGWELTAFPGGNPQKEFLDELIPDRPALFTSWDGHNMWVNSKALEMAGIKGETSDPDNGRIEKDPKSGEPSGTLRETAMSLVSSLYPEKKPGEDKENLKLALQMANELGITSMIDAFATEGALKIYKELSEAGELTVRTLASIGINTNSPQSMAELIRIRDTYRTERLNTSSVKVMGDGVPEAKTAAMLEPYVGHSHHGKSDYGILNFTLEELKPMYDSLDRAGFQIHVHALGDKAVRVNLDAMEGLDSTLRHHLAHLQIVHPEDIPRFGELGVWANFQPFWAKGDPLNMETIIPLVGRLRSRQMYPMASVHKTGGNLAAGSDWPVSTLNPWHAMQVAITRQLIGKESKVWIPKERIDLNSILRAYTSKAAYLMHQENETGSLQIDKQADLIVINQNIFEIKPTDIHKTKVLMTFLSGKLVYEEFSGK